MASSGNYRQLREKQRGREGNRMNNSNIVQYIKEEKGGGGKEESNEIVAKAYPDETSKSLQYLTEERYTNAQIAIHSQTIDQP